MHFDEDIDKSREIKCSEVIKQRLALDISTSKIFFYQKEQTKSIWLKNTKLEKVFFKIDYDPARFVLTPDAGEVCGFSNFLVDVKLRDPVLNSVTDDLIVVKSQEIANSRSYQQTDMTMNVECYQEHALRVYYTQSNDDTEIKNKVQMILNKYGKKYGFSNKIFNRSTSPTNPLNEEIKFDKSPMDEPTANNIINDGSGVRSDSAEPIRSEIVNDDLTVNTSQDNKKISNTPTACSFPNQVDFNCVEPNVKIPTDKKLVTNLVKDTGERTNSTHRVKSLIASGLEVLPTVAYSLFKILQVMLLIYLIVFLYNDCNYREVAVQTPPNKVDPQDIDFWKYHYAY